MVNKIKEILKTVENDGWFIEDIKTESVELFFIKKELDMNRGKKVNHISVTIYRDTTVGDQKFRGSSKTKISPTMDDKEIKEALDVASLAASFVKNEYYELVEPSEEKPSELVTRFNSEISEFIPSLVDAVYKEDKYDNGRINSCEFFVSKHDIRRVNSKGVDISYIKYNGMIELVAEWLEGAEEIELYKMLKFSDFDPESISESVRDMLKEARERAIAKPLPKLEELPVIFTKDAVKSFFSYYVMRTYAQYKYEGYFSNEVGVNLQGEDIVGDKISISLDPMLPNSTHSSPYDNDGFLLKETEVIKDGVITNMVASKRYADYLDMKPTGRIGNIIAKAGNTPISEMKKDPYLELFEFSDFQTNPLTGDFGGEIRLGRYFDGENIIPISGGSITGNLKNIEKNMIFSKETQQLNDFVGPKFVRIDNYSLTSAK
ncbi:metallopeptidase TldD-related protein [Mycoplasmatota bacterium WC44]